jgi:hypothetical protein
VLEPNHTVPPAWSNTWSGREMLDLTDLMAVAEDEPDLPDPEPAYDPNRPSRHWFRGYKPPSGHFYALRTIWRWKCMVENNRDRMNNSDYRVMKHILDIMINPYRSGDRYPEKEHNGPTDTCAIPRKRIADDLNMPPGTVRDALARLVKYYGLTIADPGKPGRSGSSGSGSAAVYRLKPWPRPPAGRSPKPTTRRRVAEDVVGCDDSLPSRVLACLPERDSDLGGRALPDQDPSPTSTTTNCSIERMTTTEPTATTKPLVSGRGLYHGEPTEVSQPRPEGEPTENQPVLPIDVWFAEMLAWGPILRSKAIEIGIAAGYSLASIKRAAARAGVVSTSTPTPGGGDRKPPRTLRTWHLPNQ